MASNICQALGGGGGGGGGGGSSFDPGALTVLRSYEGHGSIAYGADWGYRGGGQEDVVVSCSFYDAGLHVWSPRVASWCCGA